MILVYHHGDVGKLVHGRFHHGAQERGAGVLSCACAGLHDYRRIGGVSRLHDGSCLLKVVDVERGYAVAVFGGVVEKLSQADQCHAVSPLSYLYGSVRVAAGNTRQPRSFRMATAGSSLPSTYSRNAPPPVEM